MLKRVNSLIGYTIRAIDGEVGILEDFLFDDSSWSIRHVVIRTGGWLSRSHFVLSPLVIEDILDGHRLIHIGLTRAQLQASPTLDVFPTVSREHEAELFRYFDWPFYWGESAADTSPVGLGALPAPQHNSLTIEGQEKNPHLRAVSEVIDYHIRTEQEEFGHVEDFILDCADWRLSYGIVHIKNWWPSKSIVISTQQIRRIVWGERTLDVSPSAHHIKSAPSFERDDEMFEEDVRKLAGSLPFFSQSNEDELLKQERLLRSNAAG